MTNGSAGDLAARSRFQNGLLSWLRAAAPQDFAGGLREMIAVTRALSGENLAVADPGADGLLWRSASSFLQALLDGSLATGDEARTLCKRLERHLAGRGITPENRHQQAAALAEAIFAFASNRSASGPADSAPEQGSGESADRAYAAMLSTTLSATADLLPLLDPAPPARRLDDLQLARWRLAAQALHTAWHEVKTGARPHCREAALALVQTALQQADPPSLQLAEALAEAAGAAEDGAVLAQPGFRAAVDAALEVAAHPDGPDQKGFDGLAARLADRLAKAARPPKSSAPAASAGAPWFAEDAREVLAELGAALDHVPPNRLALLAGFDWFAQQDQGKVMAIRGLAATAQRIVGQVRADDLDQPATHALIAATLAALQTAVGELAAGQAPQPDEAVFTALRALEKQVTEQRQQAIATARAAIAATAAMPDNTTPDQSSLQ